MHGDGKDRMRASRTDREHVIDMLKAAFVQDRLTKDELDDRVGLALAARTYADLDALTADIPAAHDLTPAPRPAPVQQVPQRNAQVHTALKVSFATITAAAFGLSLIAGLVGGPIAAVAMFVVTYVFAMAVGGVVAPIVIGAILLDSRQRKGDGGQPPAPDPASRARRQRARRPRPERPGDPALAAI